MRRNRHGKTPRLVFPGNPFDCEWLVREVLASKNIRLGRNYSVDSAQRVLKVEGIQCFDDDRTVERRLIVIETKLEQDEVSFVCFEFSVQTDVSIFSQKG